MATRSGDLDPALVTWLQRAEYFSSADMDRLLYEASGSMRPQTPRLSIVKAASAKRAARSRPG